MRARDIALYVICIAIAAPLVTMTGIFSAGPAGENISTLQSSFVVSAVVGILAAGGVSIMGWTFKTPAVLTAFLGIYVFCSSLIVTLTAQMIPNSGIAAIFSTVFVTLFAVVGYFAALEIAGGPHGPFE
jgi:hypothetical protein